MHRDLKPANIKLTRAGAVKVLDFGIAKSIDEAGAAAATAALTEAGQFVGTAAYMSPEQFRGGHVDARTDVWAFGCVLFEMVTGRRAFEGATRSDVAAAVLERDPDWSLVPANTPSGVRFLLRRCLQKDVGERFRSLADARLILAETLTAPVGSTTLPTASRGLLSTILVATILGFGMAGWLLTRPPEGRLQFQNVRQVTFAAGAETQPAWSPDGGRVAYVAGGHIWVVQADGGPAVNLTRDHVGNHGDPAWSPDGAHIAFASERAGVYVMPAIGGLPTRIHAATYPRAPQWSRDGLEVAFLTGGDGANFIEIVSIRTRESRRIRIPGDAGNRFDLSWSQDGRFFAYVRAAGRTAGISRVWVLRASDSVELPATDGRWNDWSPTWSHDGRSLFYVSNRGGTMDLWEQRVTDRGLPDGDPVPVTSGVGIQQAVFSPDGRRLTYSQGRPVSNLWRIPFLRGREAGWDDAEQLTFEQALISGVAVFPGGERLVFSSDRGGNPDLWAMAVPGGHMERLTADPSADGAPSISRDGRRVAFHSYRSGSRDIWIVPSEGGPAAQITRDAGVEMYTSWSPDDQAIAFFGAPEGGMAGVFVLPLAGGEPRRILEGLLYFPQWSPDGVWLGAANERQFSRVLASGGPPEVMPIEMTGPLFRWSSDGTGIYFERDNELWSLTLASGTTERQLTRLSMRDGQFGGFALGPAHIYFTWLSELGDIWVMDVAGRQR